MKKLFLPLSALALLSASCGSAASRDSKAQAQTAATGFTASEIGRFDHPWAIAILPGGNQALVTQKDGSLMLWQQDAPSRKVGGVPAVDHGGQGGLGDVVLSPRFAEDGLVYLSWVESGPDGTRGAVAGRARLVLEPNLQLQSMEIFWRQSPKVAGRGHFSHRLAFSPDGQMLFLASGDRQKMTPAQDDGSDLGKVLRFVHGKPEYFTVSKGHRNILGLDFDKDGRLWALEHGPAGGDELNLVKEGANYGWPTVSEGRHYDGAEIPGHASRPDFAPPAISWTPVIAPGGMIFYRGTLFSGWQGNALVAGLRSEALIRVAVEGKTAREVARYPMGKRIRAIAEAPDGAIWLLEDGSDARLLRLAPRQP